MRRSRRTLINDCACLYAATGIDAEIVGANIGVGAVTSKVTNRPACGFFRVHGGGRGEGG